MVLITILSNTIKILLDSFFLYKYSQTGQYTNRPRLFFKILNTFNVNILFPYPFNVNILFPYPSCLTFRKRRK